jgi:hypothetical protein
LPDITGTTCLILARPAACGTAIVVADERDESGKTRLRQRRKNRLDAQRVGGGPLFDGFVFAYAAAAAA